jgi:hypothetical protein
MVMSSGIANKFRNGGSSWSSLSWLLGFKKLGFQVYYVEQIKRGNCVDAAGVVTAFVDCANLAYFKQITEQFNVPAALIYEDGEQIYGLTQAELLDLADDADLLVNISGHLTLEPLKSRLRRKIYLDLDPGFTQFWHAAGSVGSRLDGHDSYFTVGENIGTPACSIPTGDIPWRRTRPPVVLDHWPVSSGGGCERFTTVASWRGPYGPIQHGGKTLGLKVHEFRKFIELPERVHKTFELALDIHPADERDLNALRRHGWQVVDPKRVVPDPDAFRRYIQNSGAEFSAAQGVYVETESGWFSDRTVRYLASGKPALVQDTGYSRNYPVGEGLVAFRTLEQAVAGAERIVRDYDTHCRAARALAKTFFDSDRVIEEMLERINL